ncbi:MAG: tetratricopeptide repeat protein, partial [Terriglobia bacterium]
AETWYQKAIEIHQKHGDELGAAPTYFYHAEAYYGRGFVYAERGDSDKAIADFTEAIRLNPQDTKGFIARGNSYARKGDYPTFRTSASHFLSISFVLP